MNNYSVPRLLTTPRTPAPSTPQPFQVRGRGLSRPSSPFFPPLLKDAACSQVSSDRGPRCPLWCRRQVLDQADQTYYFNQDEKQQYCPVSKGTSGQPDSDVPLRVSTVTSWYWTLAEVLSNTPSVGPTVCSRSADFAASLCGDMYKATRPWFYI